MSGPGRLTDKLAELVEARSRVKPPLITFDGESVALDGRSEFRSIAEHLAAVVAEVFPGASVHASKTNGRVWGLVTDDGTTSSRKLFRFRGGVIAYGRSVILASASNVTRRLLQVMCAHVVEKLAITT